jgi:hypothetical protein
MLLTSRRLAADRPRASPDGAFEGIWASALTRYGSMLLTSRRLAADRPRASHSTSLGRIARLNVLGDQLLIREGAIV